MEVADQVRAFLADRFLFDPGAAIPPTQSLMQAGILDSTGAMELVLFLEDTFSIKVADADLIPQNLDTIRDIAAMVARKSGATPNGRPGGGADRGGGGGR